MHNVNFIWTMYLLVYRHIVTVHTYGANSNESSTLAAVDYLSVTDSGFHTSLDFTPVEWCVTSL